MHHLIPPVLVILIYIAIAVYRNYRVIEIENRSPNHYTNFLWRALPESVILLFTIPDFWFVVRAELLFIFSFWFLFDTSLNVARGLSVIHLGTSKIDQWQVDHLNEFNAYIIKLVLFLFFVATYFWNPYTLQLN